MFLKVMTMQISNRKKELGVILVFWTIFIASTTQAARNLSGFGGVASNMIEPVSLFSDFVFSACFIIGSSFVFASLIKYIEHRRSPLMVPISTVIFLLIAGILLILLPFTSYITETGVHYSLFK